PGLGLKITTGADTQAKVSTHVFVPEAQRRLAGGGTNGIKPVEPPSPERATDRSRSVAPPGLEALGSQYRWFHHRLISGVSPGRRVIQDLCRNLSTQVCPYRIHNCKPSYLPDTASRPGSRTFLPSRPTSSSPRSARARSTKVIRRLTMSGFLPATFFVSPMSFSRS